MALRNKSLFLYGLEVTENNSSLDFKITSGGSELRATLTLGFYSLSALLTEIERALTEIDVTNTYTASADRSINNGEENRVTIQTSGAFFSLLFSSGTRAASSCASLIGFPATDQTGATTYTGTSSAGIPLVPEFVGYSYSDPSFDQKVFGSVNVSTSGKKEALVWQIQKFVEIQFKYEPEAKIMTEWQDFFTWAMQQRLFDFTKDITNPNDVFEVTLETTSADGKGLGFKMKELLPKYPFLYDTGNIKMRLTENN